MNLIHRHTTRTAWKLARPVIALVAGLALSGPAFAGAGHQAVRADGPIVLGGQVYPAGLIELEKLGAAGALWAVMLDGRRIAMVFRQAAGGTQRLVLHRDLSGLLHLRGIRVADCTGGASASVYRRSGHVELHAWAPTSLTRAD